MAQSQSQSLAIKAPDHIHDLLARLHQQSRAQEAALPSPMPARGTPEFDTLMRNKFIALEDDKCQFVYQLLRASGATTVVEAGTSYGVSTIYLALAVQQNWEQQQQRQRQTRGRTQEQQPRVIATENEPEKAIQARKHWAEAGPAVEEVIDLREGDLRLTLAEDLELVDFLLLDSESPTPPPSTECITKNIQVWTPMALPTLKVVQPKLREGAVIVVDNTTFNAADYADLLAYVRAPGSPFRSMTLPFHNGLEMIVYDP